MSQELVSIVVAPRDTPPFPVDAVAHEEDTYLVLSGDPEPKLTTEHPIQILTEAYTTTPEEPGTVLVRMGHPIELLAVVHQLDQDPTWREEWVAAALDRIFEETERRQLRALGLPLLGAVHGNSRADRFLPLLRDAFQKIKPTYLKRLWLMVPADAADEVRRWLSVFW